MKYIFCIVDIVHRDLKLENILLCKPVNDEPINIKVRLSSDIFCLSLHSVYNHYFFFLCIIITVLLLVLTVCLDLFRSATLVYLISKEVVKP